MGMGRFFAGLLSEELNATFLNPNGKTVFLKLKRMPYFPKDIKIIEVPRMYQDTVFSYKKYGDIAYIRINSFLNNTPSASFAKLVDSLKNSKAIIFDIRSNIGGNSQYATDIVSYFTNKKTMPIWWGQQKVNKGYSKAVGVHTFLYGDSVAKAKNYYADFVNLSHFEGGQYSYPNNTNGELKDLPVVVLCNYATISSAEAFILQLKQVTSVTVIGEPTAGSSTMPLEVRLPGGGGFKIATVKALDENGQLYKYTQPDITLIPSLEDEMEGNDIILFRAIDFLNNFKKD
jgi:C-terminal processing protease CtpA/Prc